ncbi:hypothetical protein F8M41_010802 [Gigaspora margarita]|uniref:Uncharacterized protein n=1 Tax=Gigaspora margarita TaxID=4874 RepID=A0A8H4A227_GIGMA|nr:hypothetical protein F8M41_010802 [Gigaspora margarita]
MPYSNSVPDNSQNYAASNLPSNSGLNIPQTVPPNFPMVNVPNSTSYNNLNLGFSSNPANQQQEALQALLSLAAKLPLVNNPTKDEEQNYHYIPEIEESSLEDSTEFEETPGVKDPFLNLADHMVLLKSQLKSELPTSLNANNVAFTIDKDIKFENSNCMDDKSKPTTLDTINISFSSRGTITFENLNNSLAPKLNSTPPRRYKRKEFSIPSPNPNNLPAIVYYDVTTSSLTKNPKTAIDLPLLYAELDLAESSDASIEWCGASYPTKKKKENSYESDADDSLDEEKRKLKIRKEKKRPLSVIYLYDDNGNVYLREDKVSMDPRGYLFQENLGGKSEPIPDLFDYYHGEEVNKKNIFSIGDIEPGQYNKLQELLKQ